MPNRDKAKEAAENVIKNSMGTKAGEKVLVITDPPRLDLAELLRDEARNLGAYVEIILLPDPEVRKKQPLNTPSSILIGAISRSDVILNFFELIPLELRPFRTTLIKEAKKAGRVGHMIGAERTSFEHGLLADYNKIAEYSDALATILSKGKNMIIRSGPNLEYELEFGEVERWNEIGISDSGILAEKGSYGNLPAGEAFMAISPSRSVHIRGDICIDNFISEVGHIDAIKPVLLKVVHGDVTEIKGCYEITESEPTEGYDPAKKLDENLKRSENLANDKKWEPRYVRKIAEIGIGTNPKARIGESTIETEKRLGTLHIALGNNTTFGGKFKAPNHYDLVLSQVEFEIDGKIILKGGKLTDLKTLRGEFEENYNLMAKTRIEGDSLIINVYSEVFIEDDKLFKKWMDFEGRRHNTKIGDDETSQLAAKLWRMMENQGTVEDILSKADLPSEMVYQLLRLLNEYRLVSIQEKTVTDYIKELQNQTKDNFVLISNDIRNFLVEHEKEIYDQERIFLGDISEKIDELNDNINKWNLDGILEGLNRIESDVNELMRRDTAIFSSKLAVSVGAGPFLNVSLGEIDMRNLLTKIRDKARDIRKGLRHKPNYKIISSFEFFK